MRNPLYQTESTKILVEGLNEAFFGITFEKMVQEKDKALEKIIQEKDKAIQEKDKAIQEKDKAIQKQKDDLLKRDIELIICVYHNNIITDIKELAMLFKMDTNTVQQIVNNKKYKLQYYRIINL